MGLKTRRTATRQVLRTPGSARRYVNLHGLIPVMNATKWAELVGFMGRFSEGVAQHRIKDLQGAEPGDDRWGGEWYYHPRLHEWIEWMEIRCCLAQVAPYKGLRDLTDSERVGAERSIREALRERGVPFSIEQGLIRVWGYVREGVQVEWA